MLAPSALSLTTTFSEEKRRKFALAVFASISAIGFVTGVTLGGMLTDFLSWRWVFFINVPVGIITFVAGSLIIPNLVKERKKGGFDVIGAVLIATSLLTLVYAITQISNPGETFSGIAILFGISLILIISFIIVERRVAQPLIPLDIFQRRTIIISDMIMLLMFGANAALLFLITLFLLDGIGFSPLYTCLIFIPGGLGAITGSILVPRILIVD